MVDEVLMENLVKLEMLDLQDLKDREAQRVLKERLD